MIWIHLESGELRNRLQYLTGISERPRAIMQAAARGVRGLLQRHFRVRDKVKNKLGGRRTHYWLDVYKSTQLGEVTERQATVIIGDARFGAKLKDTTITAGKSISSKTGKPTRMLSIPVDAEAYGRRPALFESETGLKLVPWRSGGRVAGLGTAGSGNSLRARYVLAARIFQKADPEALPPRQQIEDAALDAAQKQLSSQVKGGAVA